jgi:hypothetical protein
VHELFIEFWTAHVTSSSWIMDHGLVVYGRWWLEVGWRAVREQSERCFLIHIFNIYSLTSSISTVKILVLRPEICHFYLFTLQITTAYYSTALVTMPSRARVGHINCIGGGEGNFISNNSFQIIREFPL